MKSASSVCTGYTFFMTQVIWLVLLALAAGFVYAFWKLRQRAVERRRASEERMAAFMAQARRAAPAPQAPAPQAPAPAPVADPTLPQQKLLLEAAAKAAEAGESALAIQLYARLVARFPASGFATQARNAVEALKKKLAKP